MCGRYYTDVDRDEMQKIVDAVNRRMTGSEALATMKTGEVFPTNIVPVYVNSEDGAAPTLMQWGFPGFPKQGSDAKPAPIINARCETIKEKPTFSRCLHQRCLVPATSYFEWATNATAKGGKKSKFSFRPEDECLPVFWMAALYKDTKDSPVPVFTILTMDASASVAPIHHRMPVILGAKDARRAWMFGEDDLAGLFRDAALTDLICQAVV